MTATKPTLEQFAAYQAAYDYFNGELFGGELRPCLLVFRDAARKKNGVVLGHFCANRWASGVFSGDEPIHTHEISLNPITLTRPLEDTLGTLVHEMAHQWQQDIGKPPRGGYHDRQWAKKMVQIGLIPSDSGEPGGKQTGQRMTHYVDPQGEFARSLELIPDAVRLPWVTGEALGIKGPKKPAERNKVKYTCPGCEANVWGKAELKLVCGECDEPFEAAE